MNARKDAVIELQVTSATVVGGEIVMPGATITVPLDEAAGLVRRGKAVRAGQGAVNNSPPADEPAPASRKKPPKA
nr:MAG TPA: hypothetical protein [Caudoviricetes sp.]